jgi:hypothetical protein
MEIYNIESKPNSSPEDLMYKHLSISGLVQNLGCIVSTYTVKAEINLPWTMVIL